MDGRERGLSNSLATRLSFALTLAIVAAALLAGVFCFRAAFADAQDLQDETLRQVSALHVDDNAVGAAGPDAPADEEESRLVIRAVGTVPATTGRIHFPATLADGFHTVATPEGEFRVYARTQPSGRRIAVAQQTRERNEIARDSALRAVMPFLLLIPVLLLAVTQIVSALLRRITTLADAIDRRNEGDLSPLSPDAAPQEIQPFISAINRLLQRLETAFTAQKRFVADAAHELRSPLTALSLQAERLAASDMSPAAQERLAALRQGIDRSRHLLNQLLTMARLQQTATTATVPALPLSAAIYETVEGLLPLLEAKRLDLRVKMVADEVIPGLSHQDACAVLRNLLDNAIRHTPAGGCIGLTTAIRDRRFSLVVSDSGPGIAPEQRERVFEPFYRAGENDGQGSGLGLAIVRRIVAGVGGAIALDAADADTASGLCVKISLPRAPSGG